MKYFVYYGYTSPDNCGGEYPTHGVKPFTTSEQVIEFKKEFDENIHDECTNVEFLVIKGEVASLIPKTTVTEWELV